VARALEFEGAAKPGVHVLGLDVSGESRGRIEQRLRAWSARPVTLEVGGKTLRVARGWLVSLDVDATARRALAARSSSPGASTPPPSSGRPAASRTCSPSLRARDGRRSPPP